MRPHLRASGWPPPRASAPLSGVQQIPGRKRLPGHQLDLPPQPPVPRPGHAHPVANRRERPGGIPRQFAGRLGILRAWATPGRLTPRRASGHHHQGTSAQKPRSPSLTAPARSTNTSVPSNGRARTVSILATRLAGNLLLDGRPPPGWCSWRNARHHAKNIVSGRDHRLTSTTSGTTSLHVMEPFEHLPQTELRDGGKPDILGNSWQHRGELAI